MYSSDGDSVDVAQSSPAFLRKLWKILENPETDSMIRWGDDGKSFIVVDAMEFVKVLPIWFKHANMASFVRQLNMYGFRKLMSLDNGIVSVNTMEYAHPSFVRSFPGLMANISRKKLAGSKKQVRGGQVNLVMSQLREATSSQETLASQLELMRTKHVQLVNELNVLRAATLKRMHPDSKAEARLGEHANSSKSSSPNDVSAFHNRVTDNGAVGSNAELGRLLVDEARARLELVDHRRRTLLREHWLRMRELELRVSAEKTRAERESTEWSLHMKSRDQKLANLRLQNDILREEFRSLPH